MIGGNYSKSVVGWNYESGFGKRKDRIPWEDQRMRMFGQQDPETFRSGIFEYVMLDDETVEITGIDVDGISVLWIPAMLDGFPVTSVGEGACEQNWELESLTLSEGITRIREYAFSFSYALTDLNLPETMTVLEPGAFFECPELQRVRLPDSLLEMDGAFSNCKSLLGFCVSPEHPGFLDVDGVLFSRDRSTLFCYPCGRPGETYSIPAGTECIANYAFEGAAQLKTVRIPDSVFVIEESAFEQCGKLQEIIFPDSVRFLGEKVLYSCPALTRVRLPAGLTRLGCSFFSGCSALVSVELPEFLTEIESFAFNGCSALRTLTIPANITRFGMHVFREMRSLERFDVSPANPAYTTIGGALFTKDGKILLRYPPACPGDTFEVPPGTEALEQDAFRLAVHLRTVCLPEGLTEINENAFYGCEQLESIRLPESLAFIGAEAFMNCRCLTSISIPDHEVRIGKSAFAGCPSLPVDAVPAGSRKWS